MNTLLMSPLSSTVVSEKPRLESRRILYADDLPELRHVMKHVLSREGHVVDCADDGEQAWTVLSVNPDSYDLLITDHHMPVINGVELVQRVRSMGFAGKILVFSSDLSDKVEEAYRNLRVDHFMMKPIQPPELRQVLAELWPDE